MPCSSVRCVGKELLCSQTSQHPHQSLDAEVEQWCFGTLCVPKETDCALLALQGVLGLEVSPVVRVGLCQPGHLGPALLGCLLAH